jgi:hypothetical protein
MKSGANKTRTRKKSKQFCGQKIATRKVKEILRTGLSGNNQIIENSPHSVIYNKIALCVFDVLQSVVFVDNVPTWVQGKWSSSTWLKMG